MDALPAETIDSIVQLLPTIDRLRFAMCNKWLYEAFYCHLSAHKLQFTRCLNTIKHNVLFRAQYDTDYEISARSNFIIRRCKNNNTFSYSIFCSHVGYILGRMYSDRCQQVYISDKRVDEIGGGHVCDSCAQRGHKLYKCCEQNAAFYC